MHRLTYATALATLSSLALAAAARAQDPPASAQCPVSAAPLKVTLQARPATLTQGGPAKVALRAEAKATGGGALQYSFSTTGGRVTGGDDKPTADWSLDGVPAGTYLAIVQAADPHGCTATANASVEVKR